MKHLSLLLILLLGMVGCGQETEADKAKSYCKLGVSYYESGNHEKAIESFKEAIRLKPDYFEAYSALRIVYERLGNHEKAKETLRKHLEIFSELEHTRGYEQGKAEADSEIAERRMTIYIYGLPGGQAKLDKRTGLPYKRIAACVVDPFIEGRAAGHNARIREHIKKHGLPHKNDIENKDK